VNATAIAQQATAALAELIDAFPGRISSEPDGLGGLVVSIADVAMPQGWPAGRSQLIFVIPFNFPAIPIYPYYIPAEAAPDGALDQALQRINWRGHNVLQLSLRHTSWRPSLDTVVGSVLQTMDWLKSR
jgi:hypothetical protein